jgi:hypothetical protein
MTKEKSIDFLTDKTKINGEMVRFFGKRKQYFGNGNQIPSYSSVRGNGFRDVPDDFPLSQITCPVQNKKGIDLLRATKESERLGGLMIPNCRGRDLSVLSREFMITGTTLPMKVTYGITPKGGTSRTESLYLKEMDINRIFLSSLYDLAMDREPTVRFSESGIIEIEKKGKPFQELYEKDHKILSDPGNKRNLVKLGVMARFTSLYDMDNGENMLISPNGKMEIIDFDKGFWEPQEDPREKLVNPFTYRSGKNGLDHEPLPQTKLLRHFKKGELEQMTKEEMGKVHKNVEKRRSVFEGMIDIMSGIKFYNLATNELYGEKDVASLLLKRLHEFGRESRKA